MATDIDQPPIYDDLIKQGTSKLTPIWQDWWGTFYQTLVGYFTQFGFLPPNLTTVERDTIQSPQNGQMIYNTSLDTMQYYKVSSGTWISF